MNIYISGPMTGIKDFNYPAFFEAEEFLKRLGHQVTNPARIEKPEGFEFMTEEELWVEYMRLCLLEMLKNRCDSIAVLQGWTDSRGSRLEVINGCELRMKLMDYSVMRAGAFIVNDGGKL